MASFWNFSYFESFFFLKNSVFFWKCGLEAFFKALGGLVRRFHAEWWRRRLPRLKFSPQYIHICCSLAKVQLSWMLNYAGKKGPRPWTFIVVFSHPARSAKMWIVLACSVFFPSFERRFNCFCWRLEANSRCLRVSAKNTVCDCLLLNMLS